MQSQIHFHKQIDRKILCISQFLLSYLQLCILFIYPCIFISIYPSIYPLSLYTRQIKIKQTYMTLIMLKLTLFYDIYTLSSPKIILIKMGWEFILQVYFEHRKSLIRRFNTCFSNTRYSFEILYLSTQIQMVIVY